MQNLPNDSIMLLSVINTKLRDYYPNIDALCDDMGVDKQEIIDKLASVGYNYDEELNKFC